MFPAMNDAEGEDAKLVDGAAARPTGLLSVSHAQRMGESSLCSPRHEPTRATENSSGADLKGTPGMRTSPTVRHRCTVTK